MYCSLYISFSTVSLVPPSLPPDVRLSEHNRGGYNVGSLYYYAGSVLTLEWTNQHSCGDQNSHCEQIVQYMCGDLVRDGVTIQ